MKNKLFQKKHKSKILNVNSKGVVYGQDEAIQGIVDKILVAQAGLKPR